MFEPGGKADLPLIPDRRLTCIVVLVDQTLSLTLLLVVLNPILSVR